MRPRLGSVQGPERSTCCTATQAGRPAPAASPSPRSTPGVPGFGFGLRDPYVAAALQAMHSDRRSATR
jgi:hypothetical protein